jgi:uncharacterized RDD family membrane protein YckC
MSARELRLERIRSVQGHTAGFVSRFFATVVDIIVLFVIGFLVVAFVALVRWVTTSHGFHLERPNEVVAGVVGFVLSVAYFGYFWGTTGRTLGEQFFGLRSVTKAGARIPWAAALLRSVLMTLFPIGVLWVLVSRRNASVQDLICRTAVVYDWRYHAPES